MEGAGAGAGAEAWVMEAADASSEGAGAWAVVLAGEVWAAEEGTDMHCSELLLLRGWAVPCSPSYNRPAHSCSRAWQRQLCGAHHRGIWVLPVPQQSQHGEVGVIHVCRPHLHTCGWGGVGCSLCPLAACPSSPPASASTHSTSLPCLPAVQPPSPPPALSRNSMLWRLSSP